MLSSLTTEASLLDLNLLQSVSETLHYWCLKRIESQTQNHIIYSAILCGQKLENGHFIYQTFSKSGLIHLMVVSGAHLIFLEKFLKFLPPWSFRKFLIGGCLILYTLMTRMHPPIFRALVGFFLIKFSNRYKLFWPSHLRSILSGIISVLVNPRWVFSTSLQMSLLGALGFSYAHYSRLIGNVVCYIFILPILSQWILLHPLSTLINWMLFPLISITLFPLCIMSFIFPPLYSITDPLWFILIKTLTWIQPFLEKVPFEIPTIPSHFRWLYIGVIFLLSQYLFVLFNRFRDDLKIH